MIRFNAPTEKYMGDSSYTTNTISTNCYRSLPFSNPPQYRNGNNNILRSTHLHNKRDTSSYYNRLIIPTAKRLKKACPPIPHSLPLSFSLPSNTPMAAAAVTITATTTHNNSFLFPPHQKLMSKNVLIELCRSGRWHDAYFRSVMYPHESTPVVKNYVGNNNAPRTSSSLSSVTTFSMDRAFLYEKTALGVACRYFDGGNIVVEQVAPGTMEVNTIPTKNSTSNAGLISQMDLIKTLHKLNPHQIRCDQNRVGRTPLIDALSNPNASFDLIKFLIKSDCALEHEISNNPSLTSKVGSDPIRSNLSPKAAILRTDRYGQTPLLVLINMVHRNRNLASNVDVVRCIKYLVSMCPSSVNFRQGNDDGDGIVSPLIQLLSQKTVTSTIIGGDSKPLPEKGEEDNYNNQERKLHLSNVLKCAEILLSCNPNLIRTTSRMSGCTPLHMALRNGYGDMKDLINLLTKSDPEGHQVRTKNNLGDLPVHVCAAAGVCNDVWKLLLEHILLATGKRKKDTDFDPIHGPNPFVWSTNDSGLNPLHLYWMRCTNGYHSYPVSLSRKGAWNEHHQEESDNNHDHPPFLRQDCDNNRSLYFCSLNDAASQVLALCRHSDNINGCNDNSNDETLGKSITKLEEVAAQILGPFWSFLKLLLKATYLGTTLSSSTCKNKTVRCKRKFRFLHAISALSLSCHQFVNVTATDEMGSFSEEFRPIIEIALKIYRRQIYEIDEFERTPLHYACNLLVIANIPSLIPSSDVSETDISSDNSVEGNDCGENVSPALTRKLSYNLGWEHPEGTELLSQNQIEHRKESEIEDISIDYHNGNRNTNNDQNEERQLGSRINSNVATGPRTIVRRPYSIVLKLIKLHKAASCVSDVNKRLPLHLAIKSEKVWNSRLKLLRKNSRQVQGKRPYLPTDTTNNNWNYVLKELVRANPDALDKQDARDCLYPFMKAATGLTSSLDSIFFMIRMTPNLI